ncbi:WD40 repeat-like protein, partial [Pluteus cervinus]
HTNEITCLSVSSDNKRVLSGSSDFSVEVWDIDSGELPVDPITGFSTEVCSVVFLAKSAQVAGFVIPFRVIIWSIVTGEIVQTICVKFEDISTFTFLSDENYIAIGCLDTISIWSRETQKQIYTSWKGHTKTVEQLCANETNLLSHGKDGTLSIWN